MPVYNDARLVVEAVASLQAQTCPDFELIVSDNASTDGTGDVCRALASRDARIRYFRQETNGGQAANFEFVLQKSRGEFFAWVCSDDHWDPRYVERLMAALEQAPEAIGAFGPFAMTDPNQVRGCDYSGSPAVARLLALCWHWDDGHEYGLFRREQLQGLSFPRWWGANRSSPYEISYPVLFFILARGRILSVQGPPLLFKRLRGGGFHYQVAAGQPFVFYLYKVLLGLNLFAASLIWTQRGGRSLVTTIGTAPGVAARVALQTLKPVPGLLRYGLSRIARATLGEARFAALRRTLGKS